MSYPENPKAPNDLKMVSPNLLLDFLSWIIPALILSLDLSLYLAVYQSWKVSDARGSVLTGVYEHHSVER